MAAPKKPTILRKFESLPPEIQWYFEHFPALAKEFPWDVTIGYLFSLVEMAHNMSIYCGVVKLHKVNASLASTAMDKRHITRADFRDFYATVFGQKLSEQTVDKIRGAESTRDRILHGKDASDNDKRQAAIDVLDYAVAFNDEVSDVAGFRPFGPLKGFKGRAKSLDKATSRWILKGIGLFGNKA